MYNTTSFQTSTHAIGGGEWSIEVRYEDGNYVREFVGSNGTRDDEEADDLWSEFHSWIESLPDDPDILYAISYERSRRSEIHRYCPVRSKNGHYTWSQAYDECMRLNLEDDAIKSQYFKEA